MGMLESDLYSIHLIPSGLLLLDPRLFIIQVPEELVQAVGLVKFSASTSSHALDLGEALVDAVALVLHLRRVKSVTGHEAVGLTIQILQAILQREHRR